VDAVERRDDGPFVAVLAAAAVLRMFAVVGRGPFIYVDSIDYETLDFMGRSRRPWATPLLYWLINDRDLRVITQGFIGVACWSVLAVEMTRHVRDRRLQWALFLAILGLSLTTTITNWDTTMLSEPLAISLTALLLAAVLRFSRAPGRRTAFLTGLAFLPWIFTRQNNLVPGVLFAVTLLVLLAVAWRRKQPQRRVLAGLTVAVVVTCGLAGGFYSRNTEIVHQNLASVMGNRVLLDSGKADWFVDHGMPAAVLHDVSFPASGDQMLAIDSFRRWIEDEGVATYAKFLLTHLPTTVNEPLEALVSERPPTFEPDRPDDVMLAGIAYGASREVLPSPVEQLFSTPGNTGNIVFLLVAAGGLSWHALRRWGRSPQWLAPMLLVGLQWPALTVVWHASTGELERLGLISLLAVWVGGLLLVGQVLDGWGGPSVEPDDATDATA
jgi:hypothetical protein